MRLPPQLFLEITRRCDQACPFCSCPWFAGGSAPPQTELTVAQWCEAASELIANGVRYVGVTGGEPTLKPGWQTLLRHLKTALEEYHPDDHELALFTNGGGFLPEWLPMLTECGAKVYLSLPGLTTLPRQTGVAGNDFRRLIRLAGDLRGIPVVIGVTVTRPILPELYETLAYAALSGAESLVINLFKPAGRGASHPELSLDEAQIRSVAQTAESVAEKCAGTIFFAGEFPPFIRAEDFPHLIVEHRCLAASGTFALAPDGFIHACEFDPEPLCFWKRWRTLETDPRWRSFADGAHRVCPLFPGG